MGSLPGLDGPGSAATARDDWTRFHGASAAIGHYLRQAHDGRLSLDEAWEAICGYNAAMLRPSWSEDRLKAETRRPDRTIAAHRCRRGSQARTTTSSCCPMPASSTWWISAGPGPGSSEREKADMVQAPCAVFSNRMRDSFCLAQSPFGAILRGQQETDRKATHDHRHADRQVDGSGSSLRWGVRIDDGRGGSVPATAGKPPALPSAHCNPEEEEAVGAPEIGTAERTPASRIVAACASDVGGQHHGCARPVGGAGLHGLQIDGDAASRHSCLSWSSPSLAIASSGR
ncbi:hypothetical protein DPM13_14045 [Paracoccus mutanolyticus]|uniref:Uncharacterized protein n=1 Tax=Paracoccus mutanolyticus TaxID=1499308 RepID=A0ABM6WT06_9RHOB|nr:hypothetical protein DPM13_14045 [Paracoccus mutanolyticus]